MRSVFVFIALQLVLSPALAARPSSLKGLSNLNPFEDVAVLQRKYLPKTERWQAYLAGSVIMNDAFFINLGAQGRLSYNWAEQHGVEAMFMDVTSTRRQLTEDLENDRNVRTSNLINAEAYLGLSYKWSPIYGKMTEYNEGIIPFDMYFSLGGGLTVVSGDQTASTVHVGTGQTFAISKNMAFRWDFSYMFFNAVAQTFNADGDLTGEASQSFANLYLNLGVSFFFPEATYR